MTEKISRGNENLKPELKISSEEEFLTLMEDIDRQLSNEGIKITARPFMALLRISERYNVTLNAFPPHRPPEEGSYEPVDISIRVHDWIEERYGKKLNVPFHIGRVVVPLRGGLFVLKCPTTYGTVQFNCDPNSIYIDQEARNDTDKIGKISPPICNILELVQDLTPHLARSLNTEEIIKITTSFVCAMGAFSSLREVNDVEYVKEAQGDFDAAVLHLMEQQPQPGLSKWASLQAIEKLLKAFISKKGGTVKFTHNLRELASEAVRLGLPEPPKNYIDAVQCPAGVRYGEISVSVDEAVIAHVVSLELCEVAAQCIGIAMNRDMPVVPEPTFDGMTLTQFLQKYTG